MVGYGRVFIAKFGLSEANFRAEAKLNEVAKNGESYGNHLRKGYMDFQFLKEVDGSGKDSASGVEPLQRMRL